MRIAPAVTNGGQVGTNGGTGRRLAWLVLAAFLAYALVQTGSNALADLAERAARGDVVPPWRIWWLEASSLAGWLLVSGLIWLAVARARPARIGWARTIAVHLLACFACSLGHVLTMVALRSAAWALAGDAYSPPGGLIGMIAYEARKDVATYVQIGMVLGLVQWLRSGGNDAGAAPADAPEGPAFLRVSEGAIVHQVPLAEIEQLSAAGNYVELDWAGRTLLHRATLAALERTLAPAGFVRIHRGRLIRRDAVRRIAGLPNGDADVTLASGAVVRASRRYREALEKP